MTTREAEILSKVIEVLKKSVNPKKIYIFGSRAKETHRNGSDFDFAVTGKTPEFDSQKHIENALEEFIGLYKIDIVYLDSVDKDFRELILHEGKVIYEKRV